MNHNSELPHARQPGRRLRRLFPSAGWVVIGWAAVALLVLRPDGLAVQSPFAYLVYDPADLAAFALRGANANTGRLPGRTDEPSRVGDPDRFAEQLSGSSPAPTSRFYLEYPAPALGLFWLEAAIVGPTGLPAAVADAEHTDVAFYIPRTDAERTVWGRLRAMACLHIVLMAVTLIVLMAVLRGGYTPELAAGQWVWLTALPAAVYFSLLRFDVLPALATALAFGRIGRGRWAGAGVWLAVGVGLKLYPVLFLPVLLRLAGRRSGVRLLVGFASALVALVGVSLLTVGIEGTITPIRVQLNRPPELGMWVLYGRLLPAGLADSSIARLGILAGVMFACIAIRPADLPSALRRCGLILLAFTQLAVFWSPQWLVWFLPLVVPLVARDRWVGWAALALDATLYLSFPVLFHLGWGALPVGVREPVAEGLIVLRSLAWGWLGWRLLVGGWMRLPTVGFRVGELKNRVSPPRGLRWLGISRSGAPLLQGRTVLQPVTVCFEPVPDGGMEDVPQAREPRQAVAIYTWDGRQWSPTGKLVFNLSVEQVAARLR